MYIFFLFCITSCIKICVKGGKKLQATITVMDSHQKDNFNKQLV